MKISPHDDHKLLAPNAPSQIEINRSYGLRMQHRQYTIVIRNRPNININYSITISCLEYIAIDEASVVYIMRLCTMIYVITISQLKPDHVGANSVTLPFCDVLLRSSYRNPDLLLGDCLMTSLLRCAIAIISSHHGFL